MTTTKPTEKAGETTRFKKGQSGNPKGRPKSGPKFLDSAYDIITDKTITITRDGVPREATIEEALQIKTCQLALDGNKTAIREFLKMIAIREQALADTHKTASAIAEIKMTGDPDNAFDALLLLDIAVPDTRYADDPPDDEYRRLALEPWAVQMALNRRGLGNLSQEEKDAVGRSTVDAESLVWPRRFKS
jgi:Family of unknown function (DUF5681)